eukprot:scaffold7561_cov227-Skeletonema_dohrnii-CCMP3373.AAC.1
MIAISSALTSSAAVASSARCIIFLLSVGAGVQTKRSNDPHLMRSIMPAEFFTLQKQKPESQSVMKISYGQCLILYVRLPVVAHGWNLWIERLMAPHHITAQ